MATATYLYQGFGGITPTDGLDMTASATDGGNTGAISIAKTGGSAKFKSYTGFGGSFSGEFINSAGNAAIARFPFTNASNVISWAKDFVCPALPTDTNNLTIGTIRVGTTPAGSSAQILVQITQAGKMVVLAGGATVQGAFPAAGKTPADPSPTAVLVPGTKYRAEVTVAGSATVATGTVSARLFNYGAAIGDYLGQVVDNAAATGLATFVSSDSGVSSYPTARTLNEGNVRLRDGVADWQGPYVAGAVSLQVNASINPTSGQVPIGTTVTFAPVANTGTGNQITYVVNWGDGSAATTTTSTTVNHTYTVAGTYSIGWTASQA